MLKLIYHGRFLHGSVTLGALSLPVGKTAVMHLVTRENLPESGTNGLSISYSFPLSLNGIKMTCFIFDNVIKIEINKISVVV